MLSLSAARLPPPVNAVTDSESEAAPCKPMPMSSSWVGETGKINDNGIVQFADDVTHASVNNPPDFGSLQCKYMHLAPPCTSYSQARHPEVRTCVDMFHPDSNRICSKYIFWAF